MTPVAGLFLIDSSVWIAVLRRSSSAPPGLVLRVQQLIAADAAATVGAVRCELLIGTRDRADEQSLRETLDGLRSIETSEQDWDAAGRLGAALRRAGRLIPATDLLIACIASRARAVLVHRDAHFDEVSRQTSLLTESHLV